MQKIKTHHNKMKYPTIIGVAAAGLLVVGILMVYSLRQNHTKDATETESPSSGQVLDLKPATDEQRHAGEGAKKDFIDNIESSDGSEHLSTLSSINISSISQNGATLSIRTNIASQNNGSCILTMSMNGQEDVTQEVETQDMGSYSVCKGFDIDTSSMLKGVWNISLYFSGDTTGAAAVSAVEVK